MQHRGPGRGLRRVFAGAAAVALAACGGGGGSGDPAPSAVGGTTQTAGAERFSNPTDPTLYAVRSASGDTFTFIGQRSTAGVPSVVTELEYARANGERYSIEYGQDRLPARVVDAEGRVVTLAFSVGPEQSVASAAAPKEARRRQVLGIDARAVVAQPDGPAEFRTRWEPAADAPAWVRSAPPELRADPAQSARDVVVRVTRCGAPANVTGGVTVGYSPHPEITPRVIRARPTGAAGTFVATIPTWHASRGGRGPLLANPTAQEICQGVASALSTFCDAVSPDERLFPGVADAIANPLLQQTACLQLGTLAGPLGPKVTLACMAGLSAAKAACEASELLNESISVDPSAPSLLEAACETQINRDALVDEPEQFVIQAAYAPDGEPPVMPGTEPGRGGGRTQRFQVSSAGAFPSLGIPLTQPWIDSLTASPAMPGAGQSYTASAEFSCAAGLPQVIEATRDGATAPMARQQAAGTSSGTSVLQLTVPASPRGQIDTLVARLGDPSSPATGMRRIVRVALGEPPPEPAVPIRLTGTGRTVDGYTHPSVNGGVPQRCESTAEWTINVNPGGTFWGSYRNPRPNVVETYGGLRCVTRATPLEVSFSGTYRDGRFELRPGNYYYTGTSKLFLKLQDVMVGDVEAGRMVTRPDYAVDIPAPGSPSGWPVTRIEHAFDLRRAP